MHVLCGYCNDCGVERPVGSDSRNGCLSVSKFGDGQWTCDYCEDVRSYRMKRGKGLLKTSIAYKTAQAEIPLLARALNVDQKRITIIKMEGVWTLYLCDPGVAVGKLFRVEYGESKYPELGLTTPVFHARKFKVIRKGVNSMVELGVKSSHSGSIPELPISKTQ